ncbi:hypothetical protein K1719_014882 [Acacia pycnantha]|nr:hypothetical protein K1719_014882 [Acacia pycnantha]
MVYCSYNSISSSGFDGSRLFDATSNKIVVDSNGVSQSGRLSAPFKPSGSSSGVEQRDREVQSLKACMEKRKGNKQRWKSAEKEFN